MPPPPAPSLGTLDDESSNSTLLQLPRELRDMITYHLAIHACSAIDKRRRPKLWHPLLAVNRQLRSEFVESVCEKVITGHYRSSASAPIWKPLPNSAMRYILSNQFGLESAYMGSEGESAQPHAYIPLDYSRHHHHSRTRAFAFTREAAMEHVCEVYDEEEDVYEPEDSNEAWEYCGYLHFTASTASPHTCSYEGWSMGRNTPGRGEAFDDWPYRVCGQCEDAENDCAVVFYDGGLLGAGEKQTLGASHGNELRRSRAYRARADAPQKGQCRVYGNGGEEIVLPVVSDV